jgi:hypothetical protein
MDNVAFTAMHRPELWGRPFFTLGSEVLRGPSRGAHPQRPAVYARPPKMTSGSPDSSRCCGSSRPAAGNGPRGRWCSGRSQVSRSTDGQQRRIPRLVRQPGFGGRCRRGALMTLSAIRGAMAGRAQQIAGVRCSRAPRASAAAHPLGSFQHKAPVPNAGALWGCARTRGRPRG